MKILSWKAFGALAGFMATLAFSMSAQASLIGQSLTHECPQCGPPYSQGFVVTQGAGPELTPFGQWELDVEAATIKVTWLLNGPLINPLDLIVTGILGGIQSVTVDPTSTVQPVGVSFTQTSIDMNFNGGPGLQQGEFWLLNINQASNQAPEPPVFALLALGLAGLGYARRKLH